MENIEIRVLSTGMTWRVDRRELGALATTCLHRGDFGPCAKFARREAARLRASGEFGFVRLVIEELF